MAYSSIYENVDEGRDPIVEALLRDPYANLELSLEIWAEYEKKPLYVITVEKPVTIDDQLLLDSADLTDSFAYILNTDLQGAENLAKKIFEGTKQNVGIAEYRSKETPLAIINSYVAMERAKEEGTPFSFYDPEEEEQKMQALLEKFSQ